MIYYRIASTFILNSEAGICPFKLLKLKSLKEKKNNNAVKCLSKAASSNIYYKTPKAGKLNYKPDYHQLALCISLHDVREQYMVLVLLST
jgi:hypothetical protein